MIDMNFTDFILFKILEYPLFEKVYVTLVSRKCTSLLEVMCQRERERRLGREGERGTERSVSKVHFGVVPWSPVEFTIIGVFVNYRYHRPGSTNLTPDRSSRGGPVSTGVRQVVLQILSFTL